MIGPVLIMQNQTEWLCKLITDKEMYISERFRNKNSEESLLG